MLWPNRFEQKPFIEPRMSGASCAQVTNAVLLTRYLYSHMTTPSTTVYEAAAILKNASRILVLSGAGLSQGSGIPTYRDIGGLWELESNLKFSQIENYRSDPKLFSRFWAARCRDIANAKPNAAHRALARLQRSTDKVALVTQNVDGLLQTAGCKKVHELHGNLRIMRCDPCNRIRAHTFRGRCLRCFSWVRPNVVLFGEELSEETLQASNEAARSCDAILVVGTSAVVYPAARLPVIAIRNGARMIVLDAQPPLLARAADVVLTGKAEVLLPNLVELTIARGSMS